MAKSDIQVDPTWTPEVVAPHRDAKLLRAAQASLGVPHIPHWQMIYRRRK